MLRVRNQGRETGFTGVTATRRDRIFHAMSDQTIRDLGCILAALGIALFAGAIFFHLVRGWFGWAPPRRCPKCWYDLSHTPGMTCSECGHVAKRERRLHKSRYRIRAALAAIFAILGGYGIYVYPAVRLYGWIAAVPTVGIVAILPALDFEPRGEFVWRDISRPEPKLWRERSDELFGELKRRATQDRLYDWEWLLLSARCWKGDARRPPTTFVWRDSYGVLLKHAIEKGHVEYDDALEYARKHLRIELVHRPKWTEDEPVAAFIAIDGWNPAEGRTGMGYSSRISTLRREEDRAIEGLETYHGDARWETFSATSSYLYLYWDRVIPERPTQFVELTINWQDEFKSASWAPKGLAKDMIRVPIEPVPRAPIDEVLEAVVDPGIDELIRDLVTAKFDMNPWAGRPVLEIDATGLRDFFRNDPSPVIAADVELVQDGHVHHRDTVRFWAPPTDSLLRMDLERWPILLDKRISFTSLESLLDRMMVDHFEQEKPLLLRLRSNPSLALSIHCCDSYWEGDLTIPVDVSEELRPGAEVESDGGANEPGE